MIVVMGMMVVVMVGRGDVRVVMGECVILEIVLNHL